MSENVTVIFGLLGGLALFLYGMNNMSDALQKAAGDKMKRILSVLTKNPVLGAVAGAVVTAVLQSSSATTVMVIGFVSAGLMTLPQGISVIFGANIGTTMTAQLMTLKISDYIYPIIFIGFILYFVSHSEQVKNIGMVFFSFGLLFEGIEIMGGVMKPLASSPFFIELMSKVYQVPVLGILLGAGMTLIVQSSSATIAVLQNFASQAGPDGISSVIGLTGAIPILLGDNIGTTITALLASIGQSKNAKRTAVAHSIFNISGSIFFALIIPWFAAVITWISPKGNEVDVISNQIANAHTGFNLICTLIWLPLLPVMVKIVTTIVRGQDSKKIVDQPRFLDDNVLSQPIPAMCLASQEIERIADSTMILIKRLRAEFDGKKASQVKAEDATVSEMYHSIQNLHEEIASYLSKLFSGGVVTEKQAEQAASLLFVNNSIERIAERGSEINSKILSLKEKKKSFSESGKKELNKCFGIIVDLLMDAMTAVKETDPELARKVLKGKKKFQKAEKAFNKAHLTRVKQGKCNSNLTSDFSSILYGLERMADGSAAIAEEVMDHHGFVYLEPERLLASESSV